MASKGEEYLKMVLESQGYRNIKITDEDIFAMKENLGFVIEEKDWKDPVKVYKNKIYQRGVNGKWYYHNRSQVVRYGYNIRKQDEENKVFRFIVCAFVFSNLIGRLVQPIYFRKFGTIFVVSRNYFPTWLKSMERSYLGERVLESPSSYMGGK